MWIHKDKKGVEHLFFLGTSPKKTTQHSKLLLQAWQVNEDMQLIIYRSDPDLPDTSEVQNIVRYVVAYAGKR